MISYQEALDDLKRANHLWEINENDVNNVIENFNKEEIIKKYGSKHYELVYTLVSYKIKDKNYIEKISYLDAILYNYNQLIDTAPYSVALAVIALIIEQIESFSGLYIDIFVFIASVASILLMMVNFYTVLDMRRKFYIMILEKLKKDLT